MSRFVDVYDGKGQQLAQLGGSDITAVPAVAQFHPSLNWIAGANASGKLCLWMDPDDNTAGEEEAKGVKGEPE